MIHLIWDLDGTLIDSSTEILYCLELAINNSDLDLSKQARPFIIGPTIDVILKEAFPDDYITEDILRQVVSNFRKKYDNSEFNMTKPFIGVERILENTQSFIHHIITNKPELPTMRILQKLGWTAYINTVNTPYLNYLISGKKHIITKSVLFSNLIINYDQRCLFIGIGDMKSDCIAANDNNIQSIGVLWGSGTREELSDYCNFVFDNPHDLHDFLKSMVVSALET
jgi:phosphoglycolate phosphatase